MDNNNDNKQKSIEELFCEMYEDADDSYSYEKQRKSYDRSNNTRIQKYKRNKTKKTVLMVMLIVVIAALWLVSAFAIVRHVWGTETPIDTGEVQNTDTPESSEQDTLPPEDTQPSAPASGYISLTMGRDAYKAGELILINSTYKYDFTADKYLTKELVGALTYSNGSFSVSYGTEQLRIDTVNALNEMCSAFQTETGLTGYSLRPDYGYCTPSQQQKWYDATLIKHPGEADAFEFRGGESEHETGRGFDLKVELNGEAVNIRNAPEQYLWIYDNCYKYGIIYRYPSDKSEITNVNLSAKSTHADHFRYVGRGAAAAMQANGWCLEQFISAIKDYAYNTDHLKVEGADGTKYELYYYPAAENAETSVQIPSNTEYTISGNNIDGYIVTLTMK